MADDLCPSLRGRQTGRQSSVFMLFLDRFATLAKTFVFRLHEERSDEVIQKDLIALLYFSGTPRAASRLNTANDTNNGAASSGLRRIHLRNVIARRRPLAIQE